MALGTVDLPIEYFPDPNKGGPLSGGVLFVGEQNTDPEILVNRKDVIARDNQGNDTTITPAQQPITLSSGGVPMFGGEIVQLLVEDFYSMTVLSSASVQQYYIPSENNSLVGAAGPAGPQGADGPTGPQGAAGPDGATGANGADATAIGDILPSYVDEPTMNGLGFLRTGTEVSRTTYADLYTLLLAAGAAGDGDGSTTFDIPNLELIGVATVTPPSFDTITGTSPSWSTPIAIAHDNANDSIYVGDRNLGAVYIYNEGANDWTSVSGGSPIADPTGVTVDQSNGDIYVSDSTQDDIYKRTFATGLWSVVGGGIGAPSWVGPSGLNVDNVTKNLYVADSSGNSIWFKDDSLNTWSNIGVGGGAPIWSSPAEIALDQSNKDIYVTDNGSDQLWKRDGGTLLWSNVSNSPPWTQPLGVSVDDVTKDVYVGGRVGFSGSYSVWRYTDSSGLWVDVWDDDGGPTLTFFPAIDRSKTSGNLFVSDFNNGEIFKKNSGTINSPTYYIKAL